MITTEQLVPVEWIAGFAEGEGTWTIHSHWNHTTVKGEFAYYKIPMLTFQVSQKERQPLDLIASFFADKDIVGKVYERKSGLGSFEWRTVGCANVHKVSKLLEPYMFSNRKRAQMFECLRKCIGVKCSALHGSVIDHTL